MPRFPYRLRQYALAGLTLLAGPAAAQMPKPAVTPPPPAPVVQAPVPAPTPIQAPAPVPSPAAPGTAIDPLVAPLFNQAVAAHQALTALTATITVSSAGVGPGVNQTIMLAYQKPNLAKVAVAGTAGPIVQFFSDGKKITIYIAQTKKYRVQTVPPGTDTLPLILNQAHSLLPRLLGHPEALTELLAQPGVTAKVISDAAALPAPVGGAAVDTVLATLPAPDGSKAQFTFDIGKTDHLLRRLVENATVVSNGKSQTFTLTEAVTALAAGPTLTAADFVFTPPPGVTKIVPPKPKASQTPQLKKP